MSFSDTFIQAIQEIENNGMQSAPRGQQVKESIMAQIDINPYQPIADLKDRPFNWKYFAGELAWYLKQDRDVEYISKFSNFWRNITNPDTNEINSNYGSLVFNEQIKWVVDSLKADPYSRQAIAFFNRPSFQFKGNKDFVCTMYANFFIRNNVLHMKVQMRSNDLFYGLTYDAPFFAFLHQTVYMTLFKEMPDLKLGGYYHFTDNLHFYERHFELAEQIKENGKAADHLLILKDQFLNITPLGVNVTQLGQQFINDVDQLIEQETTQQDWQALIGNYFKLA